MGMAQATFGLIWISIVGLYVVIYFSTIFIKNITNYIKNKLIKEKDKNE